MNFSCYLGTFLSQCYSISNGKGCGGLPQAPSGSGQGAESKAPESSGFLTIKIPSNLFNLKIEGNNYTCMYVDTVL